MPPKKKNNKDDNDILTRIAIVNADRSVCGQASVTCSRVSKLSIHLELRRCKPKKWRQECKKSCPVVKIGQ